eukprot:scaffold79502_cov36-Phaeocystis_antarctica.AAC.1
MRLPTRTLAGPPSSLSSPSPPSSPSPLSSPSSPLSSRSSPSSPSDASEFSRSASPAGEVSDSASAGRRARQAPHREAAFGLHRVQTPQSHVSSRVGASLISAPIALAGFPSTRSAS